jgi:Hint module
MCFSTISSPTCHRASPSDFLFVCFIRSAYDTSSTYCQQQNFLFLTCLHSISHREADPVCKIRKSGDPIPLCCEWCCGAPNYKTSSDISLCVPSTCSQTLSCFSGDTLVHRLGGATIPMKELRIGDQVLTGTMQDDLKYQPIYAFAHRDTTRPTKFLQIFTKIMDEQEGLPLELTEDHLVYLNGAAKPIPAINVQVGDVLQGVSVRNSQWQSEHVVTKIHIISRNGLYAPLTRDGTVVVANGIVASNYVSFQYKDRSTPDNMTRDAGYVEISSFGTIGLLHQGDVAHMWLSPFRLFCSWDSVRFEICDRHNEEGMLAYVGWGLGLSCFMESESRWVQLLVLIPIMMVLAGFMVVEYLLEAVYAAPFHVALCAVFLATVVCLQTNVVFQVPSKKKLS